MTQQQKNTALVFAMVAGLASLPMRWMTLHDPQIEVEGAFPAILDQFGVAETFQSVFQGTTLHVTGFNGHFTFLFNAPIWFIVGVAIAACALQLMRNSTLFSIPRAAEWGSAAVAVAWVGIVVAVGLFYNKATLGIGAILGLFCATVPLICLASSAGEHSKKLDVTDDPTPSAP